MDTKKEKESINEKEKLFFPLFMDLTEKNILVVGAGKIAVRRIKTIVDFVNGVTVVAPQIEPSIFELADGNKKVVIVERCYEDEDLENKDIVLAITDDHALNEEIVNKCHEKGILVNAAHDQSLCDFYFPGVVRKDSMVVGISVCGKDHGAVREAAARLREVLDVRDEQADKAEKSLDKMILAVSYGTARFQARQKDIEGIEKAIEERFPEYEIRRCFTSQMIIGMIEQREGIHIDNLQEALTKAKEKKIRELLIQPTHVMAGIEYQKILDMADAFHDKFDKLCVGTPLLSSEQDYKDLANAMSAHTEEFVDGHTAVVLVGHGTKVEADRVYGKLQSVFKKEGLNDYYVGTIESYPSKEDVARMLVEKGQYTRVVLIPLMVVVGNHVEKDIFGTGQSWKTVLEDEGFEVHAVMKGLGEYPEIQEIYVKHLLIFLS